MRTIRRTLIVVLLLMFAMPLCAVGQEREVGPDKTLSPYFFVHSDDPGIDRLPLQSTRADVEIAGVIAKVLVTQVYKNAGTRPIEATYIFPGSTNAAVFGMRMTIGERVIEARIEERQKARAEYEQARADGKSATLLEQQRPNVFQMNVANIMPGDIIKVELNYVELLVPEDGTYEFVYPTVVGPRYSNTPKAGASDRDAWVENPYLKEGEPEPFTFDIEVTVNSGIPISKMGCISHKTKIEYDGPGDAFITLEDTKGAGTKDFILRYSLEGAKIQSGVLLYPGPKEKFFLVMMEPPARIAQAAIPPREYIFILDVSGSMYGFPLDTAKALMRDLIGGLREIDKFNVVLFSGRAAVLSEKSLPATKANIDKALDTIERQTGGGGTELINALQTAFSLPRQEENVSRTTVIVTDGYVSCEAEAFDLVRKNLNKSNVFSFGIGSSVNRHLIEGMARCGAGEPFVVTHPDEAGKTAEKFREYIREPVLTQIEIEFDRLNAYDIEPLSVPDVLANRPVIVFGKYKGGAAGAVHISGYSGAGRYSTRLDISPKLEDNSNVALRYLWARHRIKTLSDYNNLRMDDKRVKEVTDLGLAYNLLTDYTSFVAIDSLVRNKEGDVTKVVQPLPLPEGVSNYAVGGLTCQKAMYRSPAVEECEAPSSGLDRLKGFLSNGASDKMQAMTGEKDAALLDAAANEDGADAVKEEVRKGADLNAKDARGRTPLMLAAMNGHAETVKALLASGAKVDAQDNDGYTALMHAVQSGHADIVKLLLENGANANVKAKDGKRALTLARESNNKKIVRLLEEAGAKR
ncbi:MAG: VWA domain-containing protein [Candidatus Abyssobacteria bacterium SURF_5]|uniref:VWA domain-containing protein n=1 Tax=Abyssobacteria bacterium (strain SURF_5) TaxID=2093360 RepID=A0A3A4N884_ABYX5|nr:MAG: VWA domain-containing protein [Candidatus Abyssubacteria bacterium SURF_5]